MHTRPLLLAALLAGFLSPARADDDAPMSPAHPPAHPRVEIVGPHDVRIQQGLRIALRGQDRVVKNAPYSAQAVSERLQQLADGNQIERRSRTASYRDSAGRTRMEVLDDEGKLRTVTIHDPVAQVTWILNPRSRSATRLPRAETTRAGAAAQASAARAAAEAARGAVQAQRIRIEEGDVANGRQIVVRRVEEKAGDRRETVRVIEVPPIAAGAGGLDPQALAARIGPLAAGAAGDARWSAKASTRELGTREFDGVKAEGKVRSYEIPAGEVGNRAPITVADESWYAPELQVTVYAKHSDPRSGDYVYRLEDIRRAEPDSALFTVPADYKVHDFQAALERRAARKDAAKQEAK